MELGLFARHLLLGALSLGDVGIRHEQATVGDGGVLDVEYASRGQLVLELVAAALAHPVQARLDVCVCVTGPVVAPFRIEAVELDDFGTGSAQCDGIATQRAERLVAGDELKILVEHRETKA
jgi:hypothetical protein